MLFIIVLLQGRLVSRIAFPPQTHGKTYHKRQDCPQARLYDKCVSLLEKLSVSGKKSQEVDHSEVLRVYPLMCLYKIDTVKKEKRQRRRNRE